MGVLFFAIKVHGILLPLPVGSILFSSQVVVGVTGVTGLYNLGSSPFDFLFARLGCHFPY